MKAKLVTSANASAQMVDHGKSILTITPKAGELTSAFEVRTSHAGLITDHTAAKSIMRFGG